MNKYIKLGLIYTITMFLMLEVLVPLIAKEHLTIKGLISASLIWTGAGIVFGIAMKLVDKYKLP